MIEYLVIDYLVVKTKYVKVLDPSFGNFMFKIFKVMGILDILMHTLSALKLGYHDYVKVILTCHNSLFQYYIFRVYETVFSHVES